MKTILLLRHADVDPHGGAGPDDPHLNAAGRRRAETLAHVAGDAGITSILVSPALRTKETVAPLAARLNLQTVQTAPDFVQQVLSNQTGTVLLVAGHSNTVPLMINDLGASFPQIPLQGHDDLFVVTVIEPGEAHVAHLKYGLPTAQ